MSVRNLIKQIRRLPVEARQEAADFVEFLIQKYLRKAEEGDTRERKSILECSFRGMWKDREDLQNSTEWVRKSRKSRWAS